MPRTTTTASTGMREGTTVHVHAVHSSLYRCNEKELYCETCDVWVRSRDQMQAHKDGANHKKMSAKVAVYECKLCFIKVPCQDTLNNHMKGKSHLKRVNQRQEKRERIDTKTGPLELAWLSEDEWEELEMLRNENKKLQSSIQKLQEEKKKCIPMGIENPNPGEYLISVQDCVHHHLSRFLEDDEEFRDVIESFGRDPNNKVFYR